MPLTVLIVDDFERFRAAARAELESGNFVVVGEAADGKAAIAAAELLKPDVVLLDIYLPDEDGYAVAHALAERGSEAAVVLISSRDVSAAAIARYSPRVRGFISKSEFSCMRLAALLEAAP